MLFTQPAESSLRSNDDRIVHRQEELVLYTFELRRDLDLAAELTGALGLGDTKRDRGFEQHAARRTTVDRIEVAAVRAIGEIGEAEAVNVKARKSGVEGKGEAVRVNIGGKD